MNGSVLAALPAIAHPITVQWMLACLVFSSFIALATWRADALMRDAGRQTRHLWSGAIVVIAGWTVLAPAMLTTERPTLASQIVAPAVAMPAMDIPLTQAAAALTPAELLVMAWIAISALLLLRLAVAVVHLAQLRRTAARAVVDGHDVLVTDNVGPAVIGGRRGDILVPSWLLEFDEPLRALVFRHEQEHRNARDPFLLWSSLIVTALLPWNLPLWFMARRLRLSLEIDCDARTIAGEVDRRRYAQLLLLIAQKHTHVPFASTLAGRESGLSHRISIMLKAPSATSRLRMSLSAMLTMAFVAAACSTRIASNLTSPAPEPVVATKSPIVVTVDSSAVERGKVAASTFSSKPTQIAPTQQAAGQPYFDFQTEKPATVLPGVSPVYPEALRAAGVTGTELIQVVVRPDSMADMSTFKALKSDNPEFTAAVKEALAKMKFSPATVGGKSVSQLVQMPFVFGTTDNVSRTAGVPPLVERGTVGETTRPRDTNTPYFDFQVDKPAMALQGAGPRYPEDLRARNIEGEVLAQFVVDIDGVPDVTTFKVLRASDPAFGEAVRAALPNMRFTPAQLSDGTKVKQLVQQPFGFYVNR